MFGAQRHADRGADVDAVTGHFERLGNGERDPPRHPLGIERAGDRGKIDRELVPGEAREQGPRSGTVVEFGGDHYP